MKAGKKLVSLFLATAMVVGLVPLNSVAAKPAEPEEPKYQPVVMEEGEEWVQTTVVEDGKEYVIVAGNEDIALANDEMKVEAAEVKVEDEKVTEFNENAVWTWDEKTGLFTQEDESYVKVIGDILATKWNIDGLKQELKADEELGLVMLEMTQYGDTKRLVYKGKDFKAEKVDKKEISEKNSLRLFVKTTEEERKAMEEEEIANYDDQIMTLEEPMEPYADDVSVWKEDQSGTLSENEQYVIVTQNGNVALCNGGTSNTCSVTIDEATNVLTFNDISAEANAVWTASNSSSSAYPYILSNGNVSIMQGANVIAAGKNTGLNIQKGAAGTGTFVLVSDQKDTSKGDFVLVSNNNAFETKYSWYIGGETGVRIFKKVIEESAPTITAEFYLIADTGLCKYAADQTKGNDTIFLEENEAFGFKGKVSKEMNKDSTDNLLTNPLDTFEVPDEIKKEFADEDSISLYEVRSDKRAVPTLSQTPQPAGQYVYASQNEAAFNIKGTDWDYAQDTDPAHAPKKLSDTLKVSDLNSKVIKFIFVKTTKSSVEYYVIGKDGNQHLITTVDGVDVVGQTINFPKFKEDERFKEFDEKIESLTGLTRDKLIGKGQELYADDGTEPIEKLTVVNEPYLMMTDNVGKASYRMKVFFGEPMKAGKTSIQLPVKMYDFDADGMFFEYCLGGTMDKSYGYSMYGQGFGDGYGVGLVQDDLNEHAGLNPYPQYTEAVYDKIAALINAGTMWDGTNEDGNNAPSDISHMDPYIRELVSKQKGNLGTYADVTAALENDGIVTADEVKNAYTAAGYMMTHFFNGDGKYGKAVDGIKALELKEYKSYDGTSYYIYDASWKSNVSGSGVIQNVVDENDYFQSGEQWKGMELAYYMPLDWAGKTDATLDQYDGANFLHSTVGQGAFIFEESKNLEFTFIGDDDVYLFINGKLAVDLGGAHPAGERTVKLNSLKEKCGLEDGQPANFTFYHMERHGTGSNFRMITNINVSSRELLTHKYAYNEEKQINSGETVEADKPYYYAFSLKNTGERDMFNLAFWDQDLGVGLYPLGNKEGLVSRYDVVPENKPVLGSWGNVILDISDGADQDGKAIHNDIPRYQFVSLGLGSAQVVLADGEEGKQNPKAAVCEDVATYGKLDQTTVAELYERMHTADANLYPELTDANRETKYRELLEEVIRNGIAVGQRLTVAGFQHSLKAGTVYNNEVQTYGSDWENNEVHGSDTHKVIARDVAEVVKVIDYGKPVTYDFYEIFQDFKAEGSYNKVELNVGKSGPAGAEGTNYVSADECSEYAQAEKAIVRRGDGKGYFWNPGTSITNAKFTFVPDAFMDQFAKFGFWVTRTGVDNAGNEFNEDPYGKYLTIYPANVVYYEDNFIHKNDAGEDTGIIYTGTASQEGSDTVEEQDSDAGTGVNKNDAFNGDQQYGYDQNYAESSGTGDSNGTSVKLENNGDYPTASFTFKGTGFDIVGRTSSLSTIVGYKVEKIDKEGKAELVEYGAVDTFYVNGTLYQIPVIHVDVEYGEYTVTLTVMKSAVGNGSLRNTFYLDGVRIYNPMGNQDAYLSEEQDVTVQKLSSMLLGDCKITEEGVVTPDGEEITAADNSTNIAKAQGATAILVDGNGPTPLIPLPWTYAEDMGDEEWSAGSTSSLLSVLQRGPNNEVYLDNSGAFAFVVKGNPYAVDTDGKRTGTLQMEAKLVQAAVNNGEGVVTDSPVQMAYLGADGDFVETDEMLVKTSTAMYYNIPEEALRPIQDKTDEYVVVIRGGVSVVEGNMIAFSNIKSKGCEIVSPIAYDEEDNNGKLDQYFDFTFFEISNVDLLEIVEFPESATRGASFDITIKVNPDNFEAIKEAVRLKNNFGMYTLLNSVDKKAFSYKLLKYNKAESTICLQGRAPTAAGNYTISLEYLNEYEEIEMLAFNINVTLR